MYSELKSGEGWQLRLFADHSIADLQVEVSKATAFTQPSLHSLAANHLVLVELPRQNLEGRLDNPTTEAKH